MRSLFRKQQVQGNRENYINPDIFTHSISMADANLSQDEEV